MCEQIILTADDNYKDLDDYLKSVKARKIFLVCGKSISKLHVGKYFDTLDARTGISVVRFSNFSPNPVYESVVNGVKLFHKEACDLIVAVGGGSAIDVAKCIKLFANMDSDQNYLDQKIVPNSLKLLAVPTTAGTGSEATKYAVIYYQGEKQSIADISCIPEAILFDASVLESLPSYQRRATMMDAFCHAIESYWSVNSTKESRDYSREAIQCILANKDMYLKNDMIGNKNMLKAANIAGKAINITQTTAGHAMCYKLTSLYGISHGHAAALCVEVLWPYMIEHLNCCIDSRGKTYLQAIFEEIARVMGCESVQGAIEFYKSMLVDLEFTRPKDVTGKEFEELSHSVNPVRLKNNPVLLDEEAISDLYHQMLDRR